MKLHGKKIAPNVEILVLPRGDGENLVFKATAILDPSEFEKICPKPEPPNAMKPGGALVLDINNPNYKSAVNTYAERRFAYMVIKSLQATEGLEWENVDIGNPDTWNYEKEMRDSGLSEMEIQRILTLVLQANALDESKVEEARNRFLAGQVVAAEKSFSPKGEPSFTESGGLVKDSV